MSGSVLAHCFPTAASCDSAVAMWAECRTEDAIRQRAAGAAELSSRLEREVSQLTRQSRLWRRRLGQGHRQLTELRDSISALRNSIQQCKKEVSWAGQLAVDLNTEILAMM